jgi:ribosome recycling factor
MSILSENEIEQKMNKAMDALHREFTGLRTGRASVNLLDNIYVEAYGARSPLTSVGGISAPEARMLTVQVWDNGLVKSVEKAIRESGLGLNPQADGQLVRIPIPSLSEERRRDLVKIAGKCAEQIRIVIRNDRRDFMEFLKKAEKDSDLSKDDHKKLSDLVQKVTDKFMKKIDDLLKQKEQEIMQV